MQLSEKRFGAEKDFFVGRSKEIELMHNHAAGNSRWQWLHIYGQSGCGKSTLLQHFRLKSKNTLVFFLDGSRGIQKKEDVLEQLVEQLRKSGELNLTGLQSEEIIQRMNHRSHLTGCNIILLIDAFDNWRSVEGWFTHWLDQLEATVRIISAGRHPLTGGWLRSGWASLIYTKHLQALSPVDVEKYARKRGIMDNNTQTQLFRFSRGMPLAMALAAEMMLQRDEYKHFDRKEQSQLISVLMDELLTGLPSSVHRLFEAASVFWRFNEERLASIIDEEIEAESFRRLIEMPFVLLKEDSWMLHDAVRAWALEDLMLRKPHTYERMRSKALDYIRMEERTYPQLRQKLHLDKMSLHENPLVRDICFSGHLDDVELRECRECDLPAIQSLYIRYHEFAAPSVPEERHMENLIRPIWEADPSSFITIWKQNKLIASYGKVPLHPPMLKVLASEPLLQPFIQGWKPTRNAFLLSFVGIDPELAEKTRAYILNTLINHFSLSEWILDFTCLKEWFPVFELCGFERAPWADAITSFGTEYRAFVLDLTKEDFLTKLDRSLSIFSEEEIHTSPAQTIQELKNLLKEWSNLPSNPVLSDTYFRMFPHRIVFEGSSRKSGHHAQQDLTELIDRIIEGNDREALLGKLLKYKYLQGNFSHERVAERLNLSMATYYRYLNKALVLLYQAAIRK